MLSQAFANTTKSIIGTAPHLVRLCHKLCGGGALDVEKEIKNKYKIVKQQFPM
jgi:hypothetical protein